MMTKSHAEHIRSRVAHNNCDECRADCERRFVVVTKWSYSHVHNYLAYVRPLLGLIHKGDESVDARIWMRKFRNALHRRISLKVPQAQACRKRCDSYLERLGQFKRSTDETYLRRFAQRGASCL